MLLVILGIWPIFLASFLLINRKNLEKETFKQKFDSMFLRIKSDRYLSYGSVCVLVLRKTECFLYNVVFVARRMAFVACSLNQLSQNPMELLYCLIMVQTWYIIYILVSKPHIDILHNYLDIANEIIVVLLLYTLIGYTATSILSSES